MEHRSARAAKEAAALRLMFNRYARNAFSQWLEHVADIELATMIVNDMSLRLALGRVSSAEVERSPSTAGSKSPPSPTSSRLAWNVPWSAERNGLRSRQRSQSPTELSVSRISPASLVSSAEEDDASSRQKQDTPPSTPKREAPRFGSGLGPAPGMITPDVERILASSMMVASPEEEVAPALGSVAWRKDLEAIVQRGHAWSEDAGKARQSSGPLIRARARRRSAAAR